MGYVTEIIPQCDGCHTTNISHRGDTELMVVRSIKLDGWLVKNDVFLCPDCLDNGLQISKGLVVKIKGCRDIRSE
ncbi:hypothetical protein CTT30_23050 (plasmid) [Vibrio coralliilyticus]|nr:hypothetical protein CTT30_23050 [Vibrio coralliilyticus]